MDDGEFVYAGFWIRVWAALIDTVLVVMLTTPLLVLVYGWHDVINSPGSGTRPMEVVISWILPAVAVIAFWRARLATPGKMAISARIVDAVTGEAPSTAQLIGRYLGYFVSTIPFGLGLIWVGLDRRKQGWHDKLAGTVVIRRKRSGAEPVRFERPPARWDASLQRRQAQRPAFAEYRLAVLLAAGNGAAAALALGLVQRLVGTQQGFVQRLAGQSLHCTEAQAQPLRAQLPAFILELHDDAVGHQ